MVVGGQIRGRVDLASRKNSGITLQEAWWASVLVRTDMDEKRHHSPTELRNSHRPTGNMFLYQLRYPGPYLNLLKPTGHVIHHQFHIQRLYALPALYLCVLYLSENKQRLVLLKP